MKLIKSLALGAMIALSFTACKKKDEVAEAAEKMCTCAKPMADLNKEMEAIKDKPEELMKRMGDMQKIGKEFETCIKGLEEKFKDKDKDPKFKEDMMKAMEAKCKDITDIMNKSAQNGAAPAN
jgi:predicted  nucleic acid-binding Zn-ribbon protein